ncbi:MAG: DUF4242 domain-containing protein [Chloroflexi bacterium]|nr:DUF4242 domain-containing protein [Chloroflexota bacterium]
MQRYLVERTFNLEGDPGVPGPDDSLQKHLDFAENNSLNGVTWVQSYISLDNRKSFCIYDAPSPEAIRSASSRNGLPVDRITEVSVLTTIVQFPLDKDFAGVLRTGHKNSE